MRFKRHIYSKLLDWKISPNRKPLILRGARQVGKTTLISDFALEYKYNIILNLERNEHFQYFKDFKDAKTIIDALLTTYNISSNQKSKTLLFIDEIQECPEAIGLLRYFYEDVPEIHVIAAGSLLEHVMQEVKSFPVGRVNYLYLYPLNFREFIQAKQHQSALKAIDNIPVQKVAHPLLKKLFHEFAIIGGMPEVVKTYLSKDSISDLSPVYESIWMAYKDDVEKYAQNIADARIIRYIMDVAPLYLDKRVKFQNFGNSNYKSREVAEALRNLNDARVIQLIYPSTDITPPIKPDLKKSPRLQFLDTGLVNYEMKIQPEMLALEDLNAAYKGAIIPHLITQELLSLQILQYKKPNFWVRDKSQSSAEVDLIIPFKDKIIPIEIKSGKEGKLKSLHQFIERTNHPYAIRMYAGEFKIEKHVTPIKKKPYLLMNLPYYLGIKIPEYIAFFVANYHLKQEK